MKIYNILILSAGRRVELIQHFKQTASRMKIRSKVVAVDIDETAPALYFADVKHIVPHVKDDKYISSLIDLCNKENIDLIIPTIDTELPILSKNKYKIETNTNAKLMISDEKVISICSDKILTQKFMEKHGFKMPKMYNLDKLSFDELKFPLFIKPKSGSSSINAFKVNDVTELERYLEFIETPILQDYAEGIEYSVDVFTDLEGNVITVVPRERLATRSGEISKGRTIKDIEIIKEVKKLVGVLKPRGHITVQLIKTKEGIEYIEINPRFGGGAPMSIEAGANSCEFLYRILKGESLTYSEDWEDNLMFLRFDQSIKVKSNEI